MTAINHALVGATIGLVVRNPAVALPAALLSHFVLDAIPHFGLPKVKGKYSKLFGRLLVIDAILCVLLVLVLRVQTPEQWLVIAAAAFLATSPDLMWAPGYFRLRRGQLENKDSNVIKRFHSKIQTSQTPDGALVEIVWFLLFSGIVYQLLF